MIEHIKTSLAEAQQTLATFLQDEDALQNVVRAGELLIAALAQGKKAYSCGNGGSMCDAMHFAEELTGRFRKNRPGIAPTALSDPSYLSCVANDYSYEEVFARYIESHGRSGDVLLAISTSGASASVLNVARRAAEAGMVVIGLTGRAGTALENLSTVCVSALRSPFADRAQELHIKIIHILIELMERELFPDNYE